jgi:poly(beta-D-mannuronate) C5 epimerase
LKGDFHITISLFVFALVTSASAFTALLISQYIAFNVLPLSIQEANAIKHKTSIASQAPPSSNEGNTIPSSPPGCISYNTSTRTISVSCNSSRLTDIDNKLHDISVLSKQSPSGVWLLSANLVIAKGATFHIDSTDTKWLKINSKVDRSGGPKIRAAYIIDIFGSLKIDSVKITSWDPTTNNYAITNGSRTGTDIFILGAPRPSIVVDNNTTGTTDISNSEIAYLGYEQGKRKGGSGLGYCYGGDGSVIKNNIIREVYFGLYTFGVDYGLDPHTGTHDMIIRNNTVYDNKGGKWYNLFTRLLQYTN